MCALDAFEAALPALTTEELLDLQPRLERIGGSVLRGILRIALAGRPAAPEKPKELNLKDAAALLERSPSWLYHNRQTLNLGRKVGGQLRFARADLERYLRVGRG